MANSLRGLSTAVTLNTTQDVRDTLFWQNRGLLVTCFAQRGLALSVAFPRMLTRLWMDVKAAVQAA